MHRHQMKKGYLLGAWTLAILIGVIAKADDTVKESKNKHVWEPKTRSVTIFKNGLGFFVRDGEVTLSDGWCLADQIPPATFGTLAIYAHNENEAVDIVGSGPGRTIVFDGHDYAKDDATKRKELHSLEQLNVELTYLHKGETQTASGKLVSVGPEFAILDSQSGNFAVSVESITKLQVLQLPLRIHVAKSLNTDNPSENQTEESDHKTKLGIAYLRKGITWIPDYTLRILDENTAELTLRGTIVNQAEDLIHTDVNLVVGVPHFLHTDKLAPLAVGQIIRTIGSAVAPAQIQSQIMNRAAIVQNAQQSYNGNMSGMMVPQMAPQPDSVEGGDLTALVGNLPQMNAAAATDYTTYTQKDLTLRAGEKAIVTLFTQKINFDHIYRWDTGGQIRHLLVLKNTTDSAWTTGPCLAVSDQRPLSEDVLKYVPRGTSGELEITEAINIAHKRTEQELNRELKAYMPRNNDPYDLVTLDGKIVLKNFEHREADMVITCPVPGKPTEASDDGQAAIDSTELRLTARNGRIVWRLKLAPGEEKTLTYKYERYVKSYDDGSRLPIPATSSPFYSPVPIQRPEPSVSKGG